MARVTLPRSLATLANGVCEHDIEAANVRELVRALSARFPELGVQLENEMSVAIDGEILDDGDLEPLGSESDIHFIPRIRGG